MVTAANRGKVAEKLVKKKLLSLESATFAHARWPDAHAGSYAVALADFLIMHKGKMTLLEVKEVAHSFRLPYANFKMDQIARMRAWKAAGAQGHVLVYSSVDKTWRAADISWFFLSHTLKSETGKSVGSWDLREVPLINLGDYFSTFI